MPRPLKIHGGSDGEIAPTCGLSGFLVCLFVLVWLLVGLVWGPQEVVNET